MPASLGQSTREPRRSAPPTSFDRSVRQAFTITALLVAGIARADASPPTKSAANAQESVTLQELANRLDRLEQRSARLEAQNRALRDQLRSAAPAPPFRDAAAALDVLPFGSSSLLASPRPEAVPSRLATEPPTIELGNSLPSATTVGASSILGAGVETPAIESNSASPVIVSEPWTDDGAGATPTADDGGFLVGGYDKELGQFILVRPRDARQFPFELRFEIFTQARYFNFARSADFWVDSAGQVQPIRDINSIEITRNFFVFSGYGLDPNLQYTAFIFSSTALNDTVYLGWINYRFSDAFDLRIGNWMVPGTREWLESFRFTMGADRLMATTYFRPNISPGIWAQGEPIRNVHYVAMIANSLNRFTQGIERVGTSTAFGATAWWEVNGDFGPGPSDVEYHENLSPRIGASMAVSRETNQGVVGIDESRNPEDTILRVSDGTPLFRANALAPGTQLTRTDVRLFAVDAAVKYRGFSLSGEYLFRWLDNFKQVGGPIPFNLLYDHGGLLQGGAFVIPKRVEGYARTSFVTGRFGTGEEFGGGVNWYMRASRDWRLTFEVLHVNGSPAQNILTGYRAGESGTLYQAQCLVDF